MAGARELAYVRRPRAEVYPYKPSWLLAVANVIAPRLVDLGCDGHFAEVPRRRPSLAAV